MLNFWSKNSFLFVGCKPEAKSIVNISPFAIFEQVDIIITQSKWTIKQLGLQLWPNLNI